MALGSRALQRRGISTIWVALVGTALIGLTGLALDTSLVLLAQTQLQAAADSAALGGARAMGYRKDLAATNDVGVRIAAQNTAITQSVMLTAGTDISRGVYRRSRRQWFPGATVDSNGVQARALRSTDRNNPIGLMFGQLFGVTAANVASAEAYAMNLPAGGLFVIDPIAPGALTITATNTVIMERAPSLPRRVGTTAFVGSNAAAAAIVLGNFEGTVLNVVGETDGAGSLMGEVKFGADVPLPTGKNDPMQQAPAVTPPPTGASLGTVVVEAGTPPPLTQGYYDGGIRVTGGTLRLGPGRFVLDGVGLDVTNDGSVQATEGTLIYIKDDEDSTDVGGVWQALPPLAVGVPHTFDMHSSDLGSVGGSATVTALITATMPRDGVPLEAPTTLAQWSVSGCDNWDGSVATACGGNPNFIPTVADMFLVIQVSQEDGDDVEASIDNVSFIDATSVEQVVNGDFGAGAANWTPWTSDGNVAKTFDFGTAPTGGAAPALRLAANGFGSHLTLDTTGSVNIVPGAARYECLSIYQDAGNPNPALISPQSPGSMRIEGACYFPQNHLDIGGDSHLTLGALVVNTVHFIGIGQTTTIEYDGCHPWFGELSTLVSVPGGP